MGLFDQTQDTKDKKKKITSKEQGQGGAGGAGAALGDSSGFGSAMRTARDYSLKTIGVDPGVQDQSIGTTLKNTVNNITNQGIGGAFVEGAKKSLGSMRDQFANYENTLAEGASNIFTGRKDQTNNTPSISTVTPAKNKPAIQDITSTKVDTIEGAPAFFKSNFTRENGTDTLSGSNGLGGKYTISSNSSSFRNGKPLTLDDIAKLDQRMTFDSSPAEVAIRRAEVNRMNADSNRIQLADMMETAGPKGIADLQKVAIDKAALGDTIAKHQSDVALDAERNETSKTQQAIKAINDSEAAMLRTTPATRSSVFNSFGLGVTDKNLPFILQDKLEEYLMLPKEKRKPYLQQLGVL